MARRRRRSVDEITRVIKQAEDSAQTNMKRLLGLDPDRSSPAVGLDLKSS